MTLRLVGLMFHVFWNVTSRFGLNPPYCHALHTVDSGIVVVVIFPEYHLCDFPSTTV
ncbi:hypothetical protein SESBI_33770 [Sesbania bispinosa]|nr:hypothetical protein SESBI_33770 [Sesbania bispinosa]